MVRYKKTHWQSAMCASHCACQPQMPHKLSFEATVLIIYVHICLACEWITENGLQVWSNKLWKNPDIFTIAKKSLEFFKVQMSKVMVRNTRHPCLLREVPMVDKNGRHLVAWALIRNNQFKNMIQWHTMLQWTDTHWCWTTEWKRLFGSKFTNTGTIVHDYNCQCQCESCIDLGGIQVA